jgi:hypothetical protein
MSPSLSAVVSCIEVGRGGTSLSGVRNAVATGGPVEFGSKVSFPVCVCTEIEKSWSVTGSVRGLSFERVDEMSGVEKSKDVGEAGGASARGLVRTGVIGRWSGPLSMVPLGTLGELSVNEGVT